MSPPPKFPRVPHVVATSAATPDDLVLTPDERAALLAAEVVVEEKLDGMNVAIWIEDGVPLVATRGGADTSDRSGERGRIRAWAATRADELKDGLGDSLVLYAEWLRRRHAVAYERLPSELVGLDVLDRSDGRFLAVEERTRALGQIGVACPPTRFRGRLLDLDRLDRLFGPSAFGDARAEGLVIRAVSGELPRVAKHVDPAWRHVGSAAWAGENRVAAAVP